jgi:hypothetical protein
VHYTTIFCTLERCNISHKKLKIIASERNEDARLDSDFIQHMANYDLAQLRLIDETSKNEKTTTRR